MTNKWTLAQKKVDRAFAKAAKREYADDHLSNAERFALVEQYRRAYPHELINTDHQKAFVDLLEYYW